MNHSDFAVIGGGIVGLAAAMEIQQREPEASVVVLERETSVGSHQSGHNSGVLHAGVYYQPGSLKSQLCRTGKVAMEEFCEVHAVPLERCGKLVVATSDSEWMTLERIAQRAKKNGVAFERVDTQGIRELEPSAAGVAGLHVPETGIVNYGKVCRQMASVIRSQGGEVRLNYSIDSIRTNPGAVTLSSSDGRTWTCDRYLNCGGLHSDVLYRMAGGQSEVQIVPFRGEYYQLVPQKQWLCRHLIYPVPDPSFPFLGVHFTRMIDGGVECGPNAVLALARHGYQWKDVNLRELTQTLRFAGFQRMVQQHWRVGLGEIHRSLFKSAFVRALQKLIPEIRSCDLVPGRAGVRAQAIASDGSLVDDFLIESTERAIHVLNAPSPAATASLAIANHIVSVVLDE